MNHADARALLEAVTTEEAELPEAVMDRLGVADTLALVTSALVDALDMKFDIDGDFDSRLVPVFAAQLRREFPDIEALRDDDDVDAVIRGGMGDYELLDSVGADELLTISVAVIRSVLIERFLGPIDLANFVHQAIESAADDSEEAADELVDD